MISFWDKLRLIWRTAPQKRKDRLDQHFYAAKKFASGRRDLWEAIKKIQSHPKDKKIPIKYLDQISNALNKFDIARSLLDSHYHDIITTEEFMKWGHIYYNEKGLKEDRRGK